jgi:hydrogenase nickel incorporation protein HypA/HybF
MHEAMIAESILAAISSEAVKYPGKPIAAKISCGAFASINDELLNFAFEAIAKGTRCEGIRLEIEHKPIRGQCHKCQSIFDYELSSPLCPQCRSDDVAILPEEPLLLETIEFETD